MGGQQCRSGRPGAGGPAAPAGSRPLTLEIWEWNSAMLEPSICPNLLSTSLCQESYFRFTLDWTCGEQGSYRSFPAGRGRVMAALQEAGGAYLAVIYHHRPKLFLGLCVVEGSSGLPYLDQESLPLVEIFPEPVIDVLGLHVPQALILKPDLQMKNAVSHYSSTSHFMKHEYIWL